MYSIWYHSDLDLIHSYSRTSDNLVHECILLDILGKIWTSLENLSAQTSDTMVQKPKVTFLSVIIPHQTRPSNPTSENIFGTLPGSVPPLTAGERAAAAFASEALAARAGGGGEFGGHDLDLDHCGDWRGEACRRRGATLATAGRALRCRRRQPRLRPLPDPPCPSPVTRAPTGQGAVRCTNGHALFVPGRPQTRTGVEAAHDQTLLTSAATVKVKLFVALKTGAPQLAHLPPAILAWYSLLTYESGLGVMNCPSFTRQPASSPPQIPIAGLLSLF